MFGYKKLERQISALREEINHLHNLTMDFITLISEKNTLWDNEVERVKTIFKNAEEDYNVIEIRSNNGG